MTPPLWLDESAHPRPTRPCPKCQREIPISRWPVKTLPTTKRWPYQVMTFVGGAHSGDPRRLTSYLKKISSGNSVRRSRPVSVTTTHSLNTTPPSWTSLRSGMR